MPRCLSCIFAVFVALVLGSCAWTTQTALQAVTFETPGALDAECDVMAGRSKYVVRPPETITLPKAVDMLTVACLAPGGRRKTWEYLPKISPAIVADAALGVVPGMAWDHYSGALYSYPEKIEIDFRDVPLKPEPLPGYHNADIDPPWQAGMDEETPGFPGLNADPVVPARPERRTRNSAPSEADAAPFEILPPKAVPKNEELK